MYLRGIDLASISTISDWTLDFGSDEVVFFVYHFIDLAKQK
jgi:hypothetical protein